jgi:hypothetical protein
MNESADPCNIFVYTHENYYTIGVFKMRIFFQPKGESFYEFSCGNYTNNLLKENDDGRGHSFAILRRQVNAKLLDLISQPIDAHSDDHWSKNVKKLYSSCVDLGFISLNYLHFSILK